MAQLTIHERNAYDRYTARFTDALRPFEARLLAADERPEVLEGVWLHEKVVLIAFADEQTFRSWAASDLYVEIAVDRVACTSGPVLLLHGI